MGSGHFLLILIFPVLPKSARNALSESALKGDQTQSSGLTHQGVPSRPFPPTSPSEVSGAYKGKFDITSNGNALSIITFFPGGNNSPEHLRKYIDILESQSYDGFLEDALIIEGRTRTRGILLWKFNTNKEIDGHSAAVLDVYMIDYVQYNEDGSLAEVSSATKRMVIENSNKYGTYLLLVKQKDGQKSVIFGNFIGTSF